MVTVDRRKETDAVNPLLRKSIVEKVASFNNHHYYKGLWILAAQIGVSKVVMVMEPQLSNVMQKAIEYGSVVVAVYFGLSLVNMAIDESARSSRRSGNTGAVKTTLG
jgi:hypothetical protein